MATLPIMLCNVNEGRRDQATSSSMSSKISFTTKVNLITSWFDSFNLCRRFHKVLPVDHLKDLILLTFDRFSHSVAAGRTMQAVSNEIAEKQDRS